MAIYKEDVNRLEEIKDQIRELVEEAQGILQTCDNRVTKERAKSYWIPQLYMALDNNHEYLGGSMCTMEDTIAEIEDQCIDEDDKHFCEVLTQNDILEVLATSSDKTEKFEHQELNEKDIFDLQNTGDIVVVDVNGDGFTLEITEKGRKTYKQSK